MNDQHEKGADGKGDEREESLLSDPMADLEEVRVVLNTLNSFLYVQIPTSLHVKELLLSLQFRDSFHISHMLSCFIVRTAAWPTTT